MVKSHLHNILTYYAHGITNAVSEGINSRAGYFTDPRETRELRAVSCGLSIVVMEATEHWEGHDVPLGTALCGDRSPLVNPLVRARGVVVADVLGDDALEVPAVQHENVVEALATQRPEKALADGVHVRRAHRRADHSDAGGARERIEGGPELVVAVANQEPWPRLLVCSPG